MFSDFCSENRAVYDAMWEDVVATLLKGKRPGTYGTGGWVGSRAGLDGCINYCCHRDSIPGPSSP